LTFNGSRKLAHFLQLENAKNLDICVIFAKKSWVAPKLGRGGLEQNWGDVLSPFGPDVKPPLTM